MWLYLPKTISPCLVGLEDSTSPSSSLFQRLAVSAMWRQKFLQPRIWRLVLRKVRWMTRLSGLTCEPSTAERGVALLMESLRASRAQTTPSPASELESLESTDNSGTTYTAALARFDPTGSIWRTCPESLYPTRFDAGDGILTSESGRLTHCLPDFGLFLETWPRSGSMRNGCVYQQPNAAFRTSASESSFSPTEHNEQCGRWPTARSSDADHGGPNQRDSGGGLMLPSAAAKWTTPNSRDADKWHNREAGSGHMQDLSGQAHHWKTPHGMGGIDASGKHGSAGGGEFAKQVNNWPTPDSNTSTYSNGHNGFMNLREAASKWNQDED